jgi:hypothetical protein
MCPSKSGKGGQGGKVGNDKKAAQSRSARAGLQVQSSAVPSGEDTPYAEGQGHGAKQSWGHSRSLLGGHSRVSDR